MMKHLRKIDLLILALRDLISPAEQTSNLVYRRLAMVPIRSSTIHPRRLNNRLHSIQRGELLCRKR